MTFMKIITESDLRIRYHRYKEKEIYLSKEDFLTQAAEEYVRENGLKIVYEQEVHESDYQIMQQKHNKRKESKYVDSYGNCYKLKPEYLTSLNDNILVSKSHPRIILRGKID